MLYIYDGTEYGFLTAFLHAFSDKDALLSSRDKQLVLGYEPRFIQTDIPRVKKAAARLKTFDGECLRDLSTLLRSGENDSEQVAFEYLRLLAQTRRPIRNNLAIPIVFKTNEYLRKVGLEIHRFHGFIRFMETESGALYAPFAPDNDICDLLLPHFRARLPQYPFVLHDTLRKKAAVYDGKNSFVAPLDKADILLSANETGWQALWKGYYAAVNIPSRERLKQMRGYMPARYWKFMPERTDDFSKN